VSSTVVMILVPAREVPEQPAADPEHSCGVSVYADTDLGRATFTCTREPNHGGDHVAHGRKDGVIVGAARWPNPPEGRPS
jgi:hypothetical protein